MIWSGSRCPPRMAVRFVWSAKVSRRSGQLLSATCGHSERHGRNLRPLLSGCCRCCRRAATGRATPSPSGSRSARGPSGGTSTGCATSAIRSSPPAAPTADTGSTPVPNCRRCCSTTTRRSPSRSRCRRRPPRVAGIEEASLRALATVRQVMPARLRHRVDALRVTAVPRDGNRPRVESERCSPSAPRSARGRCCASTTTAPGAGSGGDGAPVPRRPAGSSRTTW